jgi:hypothetical protein
MTMEFMEDASLRKPMGAVKRPRFFTVMVVAFGLLTGSVMASSESNFCSWFTANESRLFKFELDQGRVFDDLSNELKRVNGDLTFEFGPVKDGKREFVISAGGIRSAFPAVEALYGAAPPPQRWVWVKYRPRREKITFGQIGYLFLDEALGEYAMETQVAFVEFQSRSSQYFERSGPLTELPPQFDHFWGLRNAGRGPQQALVP